MFGGHGTYSRPFEGSRRCVLDLHSIGGHDGFEVCEEGRGILLRPEVEVERMQLVEVFLLVALVVGGKMPLRTIAGGGGIDS